VSLRVSAGSLLLVAGLLACEKADPAIGEPQFCTEYARRECASVAPLCAASVAQCESVRVADCQARTALLKTPQYTARLFRQDNVTACLDKVKETYGGSPIVTGAALSALEAVCNRVYQGSSKNLEACQVDFDCDGGLVCDPAKLRCGPKRVVSAGGQCANIGETCSAGEFCKLTGATYLCARRVARAAACSESEPCLESLLCAGGVCVDKAKSGEPCVAHSDCDTGYCSLASHKCATGLVFAEDGAACRLFLTGATSPDAGAADAF
jgi:hypothetical protein